MRAMLFAAGLGTRLRPLTDHRPKALVEVAGQSLLEINLRRLARFGFGQVVVNAHHFSDQIIDFIAAYAPKLGLQISLSDESELLLDTGGGLAKARPWLDGEPFLVHNVDILSDLDLGQLYRSHVQSGHLATLAVQHRPSSRQLLFDSTGMLCGWRHNLSGAERWRMPCPAPEAAAFSGIYMLSPEIFRFLPEPGTVMSIIDVFLQTDPTERIQAYYHDGGRLLDVGKPEALEQAAALVGLYSPPTQDL